MIIINLKYGWLVFIASKPMLGYLILKSVFFDQAVILFQVTIICK